MDSAAERIYRHGKEAWPEVEISESEFRGFLLELSAEELESVAQERACDMYLAFACGRGDSAAVAYFDSEYIGRVPRMLSHMKLSPSQLDEVRQQVRLKLLVAREDAPAKIADYANRGKLDGLVQVVATRAAISLTRQDKPQAGEDALLRLPDPAYDPGLHYMKESYREAFASCFEEATRELSSRDRNLLRLHVLDKVGLEQLAAMYDVHRATVVRWLAKVRETLMMATRERLASRLRIEDHELESLMQLIQSKLDLSVRRMLQSSAEAPPSEGPD